MKLRGRFLTHRRSGPADFPQTPCFPGFWRLFPPIITFSQL
jgi:hypothetical protein